MACARPREQDWLACLVEGQHGGGRRGQAEEFGEVGDLPSGLRWRPSSDEEHVTCRRHPCDEELPTVVDDVRWGGEGGEGVGARHVCCTPCARRPNCGGEPPEIGRRRARRNRWGCRQCTSHAARRHERRNSEERAQYDPARRVSWRAPVRTGRHLDHDTDHGVVTAGVRRSTNCWRVAGVRWLRPT